MIDTRRETLPGSSHTVLEEPLNDVTSVGNENPYLCFLVRPVGPGEVSRHDLPLTKFRTDYLPTVYKWCRVRFTLAPPSLTHS